MPLLVFRCFQEVLKKTGMKEDKVNMTIIRNHSIDLIESKRPNIMRLFKVKKKKINNNRKETEN